MPDMPADQQTHRPANSDAAGSETCMVVGSGPAGVACATALLNRGRRVHMLDAGVTLEGEKIGLVQKLGSVPPEKWEPADIAGYQSGMNPDVGGVPLKLVYGSDFAYREADEHLGVHYDNAGLRPSFARGGLSNVWGAAMMPYLDQDLADWPIKSSDLKAHYPAVIEFTGLSACRDDLEKFFPLHTNRPTDLQPSRQSRQMLEAMEQNREKLASAGIHFGRSRVAVRGNHLPANDGCVYCRLCMYGCPYGFIYTSADTVTALQKNSNFTYEAEAVVTSVKESGPGVEIIGHDRVNRKPRSWRGRRVFIAAGTIATTRILLRSLEAYEQTAWIKDSQYFLLPLVLRRRVPGATREALHALSQLFIEIIDPAGRDTSAHVQIYSNSDLVNEAVAKSFGPVRGALGFFIRNLQERLLIAQGFVHSRHSSRIAVRLKKDKISGDERLELVGEANPAAKERVRQVVRKLSAHSRHLGAFPLPIMLKVAEPGRSFHSGGSFPMTHEPKGFQTDLLGRVPRWRRIHAVDATVFPSIPATTITFSAMANAHRIGWEAAQLPDF